MERFFATINRNSSPKDCVALGRDIGMLNLCSSLFIIPLDIMQAAY